MKPAAKLLAVPLTALFAGFVVPTLAQTDTPKEFEPLPAPEPLIAQPFLTEAERAEDLVLTQIDTLWQIGKNNHYSYACSTKFNLQAVYPISYVFEYNPDDSAERRVLLARQTDMMLEAIVKDIVSDPTFPTTMRDNKFKVIKKTVDDLYNYSVLTFVGGRTVNFKDPGDIIVAKGCGGIDTQAAYKVAKDEQKTVLSYGYL